MGRLIPVIISADEWYERSEEVINKIRVGGVVLFPTETVYGVGALPTDEGAKRLVMAKGRPKGKPFQLLISDVNVLDRFGAKISPAAEKIIKKFWPGPLTVILEVDAAMMPEQIAQSSSVGFRLPAHEICRDLIRRCGGALASSSANVSGNPESRSCAEGLRQLPGMIDAAIDAGEIEQRLPSTVISVKNGDIVILRKGEIPESRLLEALVDRGNAG